MNTEPTDDWNGTIRHPFFEWTQAWRKGGQVGLKPEHLLQGIDHVCGLMGMNITRTPAGQPYGVACETVVLHYGPWAIRIVDADYNDIAMPTTIEGCEETPVLPAVFFLGEYLTRPLPQGSEREEEIAGFRLMLVGCARARGKTVRWQTNPSSLRETLRVELVSRFERLTP